MLKKIAIGVGVVVFAMPILAAADTDMQTKLVNLYQQLIQLLQQELTFLQNKHASMTITPSSGAAPLIVTFTVSNTAGDENIDFGDGHSVGSSGCAKNAQNWCDLSKPVMHTYQLPGMYTVKLFDKGKDLHLLSTAMITVTAAGDISQTRGQ